MNIVRGDCMKKRTLDEYIAISKSDVYFYIIFTLIICIILFTLKVEIYFSIILILVNGLVIIDKFIAYQNNKKIKDYLIKTKLFNKIGKIDFWNDKNYFLTDNYIIIMEKKKIFAIEYKDISKIYKIHKLKIGKNSSKKSYLNIITVNDLQFKILTFSTILSIENIKDISSYLLDKNPNIIIEDEQIDKEFHIINIFHK